MTNNEVTSHYTDSKLTRKSTEGETYTKRTGSAGAEGHLLEINLLTLCKLRGDQQLKDFYLAGNLESASDFDDVVFRYIDASDRHNVIFLQSKFKQNANHKVTVKTFEKDGDWPLHKYFKSFTQIQDEFNKSGSNDPIYGRKTDNLNYHFVIYTNANRHDDMTDHVVQMENPLSFIMDESYGQAFKLKVDKAIELLEGVQHDLEIEQVIKLLKQIHISKCKNLERDDNFKKYHAFFTQTVLVKDGEYWKYRNDFLEDNIQDEFLKKFRKVTIRLHTDQISSNEVTISRMKKIRLELPCWFGNTIPDFNEKLCKDFIQIASHHIFENTCTITNLDKKLLKEVSKFVGNVLVFDEGKGMFIFNKGHLEGTPKEILCYLTNQLNRHNTDQKLYFDIQLENFPRLSLGYTKIDSQKIGEFVHKLTILTGQPDVQGIKRIIKTQFGNVSEMETARYHEIFGRMSEWWRQLENCEYLRKDDGFMDGILIDNLFNVIDPMTSFIGRTEELERLHKALQHENGASHNTDKSEMVLVSGLGGIGKTQLARQYVHIYGHSYGSIIWIDAETQVSMGNCFRRLWNDYLNVSKQVADNTEMDMKSIVQKVYAFFQNRYSLFIFDNAQYFKSNGSLIDGMDNFLPTTNQSKTMTHFIITSRNQEWPNVNPIKLNVLNDVEAEELVKCSLVIEDNEQDNDVRKLINNLHNFPLALQQAVAYIKQKVEEYHKTQTTEFKISNYLKLYKDKTQIVLDFKFPDNCADKYTETTFSTWNTTLEKIRNSGSDLGIKAIDIFNIMAYIKPNDIPIKVFSTMVTEDSETLSQAFMLIHKYSMITLVKGMANIHLCVQSVTRLKLQVAEEQKCVLEKALTIIRNHTDYIS